ncbi:MAG: hypothetical protein GKC10_01195 [Methanosarcinales archaeon]|nr:hypothetical protein [Methanosarcinales archaeon]
MRAVAAKAIIILLLITLNIPLLEGKIGYSLNVVVNNSTMQSHWSRSESTSKLKVQSETRVSGDGNYSNYLKISGLAGIGMHDRTHANQGRLAIRDTLQVESSENWIDIEERVTDNSEQYSVEINESLPTSIFNNNRILYQGEGIRVNNVYTTREDRVETSFQASKFTRSVAFAAYRDKALISARVTPSGATEVEHKNAGMAFKLSSASDIYSGIRFVSGDDLVEEDYLGQFALDQKVMTQSRFNLTEAGQWSGCCILPAFSLNRTSSDANED